MGGSRGAPAAAPQQPQAAQSLPQAVPFASAPRATSYQQPPCRGRNAVALGDRRSVQFIPREKTPAHPECWDRGLRSAFLYPNPGDDTLSPLRRPCLLEDTTCHLPKATLQPHCYHTVEPPSFSAPGISDWGCKSKNYSPGPQARLCALERRRVA